MNKTLSGTELKNKLLKGIETVNNSVSSTLGPSGRNVLYTNAEGNLNITKDGVTVAKQFSKLEDPYENYGAQLLKEVSQKAVDKAGDGPQPLYSKVLTPTGWVTLGELKIGDTICGTNNSIQTVEGVYPKGMKQIVKVKFSDGRVVECCLDHLWQVTTNYGVKKILTVKEMLSMGISNLNSKGDVRYRYYTPTNIVEFHSDNSNVLDPYLVGLLLGDGSLSGTGSLRLDIGLKKEHVLNKMVLPEGITYVTKFNVDKKSISVTFTGVDVNGKSLKDLLKDLGLIGVKSDTKFIPKSYLYSSQENREKLLQGLTDTDGHINNRGLLEYSTVSHELHLDVLELLRSLGKSTFSYLKNRSGDSYSNTPIYVISELIGYKHGNKIVDIELTDEYTEMMCIKVSNPDHLYVTNDYILTHNTTTATLLTTTMIQEGMKLIQNGSNVVDVKTGIDLSVKAVVNKLKQISVDIISNEQLKQVATLSGNNDVEVGTLIATALDKVGEDGVVAIEESKTGETRLEIVEGMMFERGFKSPYFATNTSTMEAVLEKPLILLFDGKITQANQLVNVLNFVAAQSRSLLIVAEDIEHEALALLIVNKSRGVVKVCAVKAPDYGDRRTHLLEDMAVLTGGVVLSPTKGNKLDKISSADYKNYLGEARLSTITNKDTTIVDGKSKMVETEEYTLDEASNAQVPVLEPALDKRLREIKEQFDNPKLSAFEKENLQSRISKLTGGVAIIEVGGLSEVEMKEKKDRVDDALHATKAAWEQGIVPGGGMALINCEAALDELILSNRDQYLGKEIVRKSLYAPFQKILENAGIENSYEILSNIRMIKDNLWYGYNVKTKSYVDFKDDGVIDPTKVTRTALENAASVAGIVLTTESAIITIETEDNNQMDNNMFGGM